MVDLDDMKDVPKGAIIQRKDGSYSVLARAPMGEVTPEMLDTINSVVKEFNLPGVRVTGRQQVEIQGVSEEKLAAVVECLGSVGNPNTYLVQACIGISGCRLGMQDSLAMAAKLEKFLNKFELPWKLKSSVSGCSMACAESYVRDVGLVGMKNGWVVLFGGNAGKGARKADVLAEDVSDERAFEIIGKALDFYSENAKKRERTAPFVERVGIGAIIEAITGSSL
ncbi:nitrite reductase [Pseudodesulfovibrio sp.]|nr:nitrite reductase [Pseudodesulfovibrio sp.]